MNIIFDIDDTLYNLRGPFEKAHESIFGDRVQVSMEWLFQRSRIHSDAAFYQQARGEINAREEFAYRIRMTYRELGIEASDEEIEHFEELYRYHQKHISLFPGMEDLLTWLSTRGVRLGILTNGAHDKQWLKAQALDVFRWIPRDAVFISGDLPAPKPDFLAFRAVEEGMNLDREETWYVGDNFYADMVGAQGAGWHSIWFNHRGQTPSAQDVKPDYEVTSIQDLKDLIYRLAYGLQKDMAYYSLNHYLRETFGEKVYRLALEAGMTCPNRDGTIGLGGCIFCSGGGSGEFAQKLTTSIRDQIDQAKSRISQKTKARRFVAYFQSYTNTYAPVEKLRSIFTEAISHPDVVALSIGTRPDCLPPEVVALLKELNQIKPVWVELGLQTIHENTAAYIRRGYPLSVYEEAVSRLQEAGIQVITHVILGLPGESKDMILETIRYLAGSPHRPQGIKLQLLHVLRGTDLATDYDKGLFQVMTMEEYFDLLGRILPLLPPDMVIHRLTGDGPKKLLIAPQWSGNKKLVLNRMNQYFKDNNIRQASAWPYYEEPGCSI